MAAIISTPSSRPWVASAGLAPRTAPRSARDQGVGPSVRGEAPRVCKRSFRRGRYVRLRRMQDDALERIARIVPRRPLQGTPCVGIARLPAQANPRRAEIDILGVVFVVQPGRSNRRNRARARRLHAGRSEGSTRPRCRSRPSTAPTSSSTSLLRMSNSTRAGVNWMRQVSSPKPREQSPGRDIDIGLEPGRLSTTPVLDVEKIGLEREQNRWRAACGGLWPNTLRINIALPQPREPLRVPINLLPVRHRAIELLIKIPLRLPRKPRFQVSVLPLELLQVRRHRTAWPRAAKGQPTHCRSSARRPASNSPASFAPPLATGLARFCRPREPSGSTLRSGCGRRLAGHPRPGMLGRLPREHPPRPAFGVLVLFFAFCELIPAVCSPAESATANSCGRLCQTFRYRRRGRRRHPAARSASWAWALASWRAPLPSRGVRSSRLWKSRHRQPASHARRSAAGYALRSGSPVLCLVGAALRRFGADCNGAGYPPAAMAAFAKGWRPEERGSNQHPVSSNVKTAHWRRGILPFTHLAREGRITVTIGRRELLAALGGAAAAWPLAARAQHPGKCPLSAFSARPTLPA